MKIGPPVLEKMFEGVFFSYMGVAAIDRKYKMLFHYAMANLKKDVRQKIEQGINKDVYNLITEIIISRNNVTMQELMTIVSG